MAVAADRQPWSREEVEATVADYRKMLLHELRGEPYNKAEHNRNLQRLLAVRSRGAIERKHQNISAVLLFELRLPYIDGYKPLRNVQQLLREVVADWASNDAELHALVEAVSLAPAEVPSIDDILRALEEPPVIAAERPARQVRERRPVYTRTKDYLLLEARNSALGRAGEEFVVNYEKARLIHEGHERLADAVEQVSVTRGDGDGFDILSFSAPGRERFIEVKTTAYGAFTPFYVTRNELEVSRTSADRYHVYRVHSFRKEPKLYALAGAIDANFGLDATQYVASVTAPR